MFGQASRLVVLAIALVGPVLGSIANAATFAYPAIGGPVLGATFSADFAAFTGHRTIAGVEVNRLQLTRAGLVLDLSDALFGTTDAPVDPPLIDQGTLQTGVVTVPIDPAFFPALAAGGTVGLVGTLTDTHDGLFAIDFFSLSIQTAAGTTTSFIDENDGFGIGLPDGALLPSPLPTSIPVDATGEGFDEAIGSISFQTVSSPPPVLLLCIGFLALAWVDGRRGRGMHARAADGRRMQSRPGDAGGSAA